MELTVEMEVEVEVEQSQSGRRRFTVSPYEAWLKINKQSSE